MTDLVVTYVDAVTNKPVSKQLSGDYVGVRHSDGFLVVGSARSVTRTYAAVGEDDPLEGQTYEDQEAIEEFHIPERAVYCVSVVYDPPKDTDIDVSETATEDSK